MKTAYIDLVKTSIRAGHTVSVWDGEEWQVKRSKGFRAIVDAIKSVEEAELRIRNDAGDIVGWAHVSAFGLEKDETVMNWSGKFIDEWFEQYEESLG